MNFRVKRSIAPLAVLALFACVTKVDAQGSVGYPPTGSPYVDLEFHQEFTIVAGQYHAHRDPANVGPQSGLLIGAHYEWRPTGPIHLIAELDRISSNRRLINPAKPAATRELGTILSPAPQVNAKRVPNRNPPESGAVRRSDTTPTPPATSGTRWCQVFPPVRPSPSPTSPA